MTRLRWVGIIMGLLLVLGSAQARAQSSADAFFHEAAQRYVNGDREGARRAVERGLEVAPNDARLQALRKKLEQQEERSGGGSSSQQGGQDPSRNRSSRGTQSRNRQSGTGGDAASRPQGNPSAGQQGASEQRSSRSSGASTDPAGSPQRRGAERDPETDRRRGALSRAQAARLLRALERQEMKLLREVQARGQKSTTVEKDW